VFLLQRQRLNIVKFRHKMAKKHNEHFLEYPIIGVYRADRIQPVPILLYST